jgi:hypothetical protein
MKKSIIFFATGLLLLVGVVFWLRPSADAAKPDYRQPRALSQKERQELLASREDVWRAFFANDQAKLEKYLPNETFVINSGEDRWADRAKIFSDAKGFAQAGGKLLKLEFPRTEVQAYGDVVILYTTYLYEIEIGGGKHTESGYGTEIFVKRNGVWLNPGWHLDAGK